MSRSDLQLCGFAVLSSVIRSNSGVTFLMPWPVTGIAPVFGAEDRRWHPPPRWLSINQHTRPELRSATLRRRAEYSSNAAVYAPRTSAPKGSVTTRPVSASSNSSSPSQGGSRSDSAQICVRDDFVAEVGQVLQGLLTIRVVEKIRNDENHAALRITRNELPHYA